MSDRVGELGADYPCDEVGSTAGRNRDDELDRTARIAGLGTIRAGADKLMFDIIIRGGDVVNCVSLRR